MTYTLKREIWTDDHFDEMSFHDVTIRSFLAVEDAFEVMLDLDYMFEWAHPAGDEKYFSFWIAPATLVFHNAHDVRIDIRSSQGTIEIADLRREELGPTPNDAFVERRYHFECQEGELSLTATSFAMYVRRAPVLAKQQRLELAERDGIGFGRFLETDE